MNSVAVIVPFRIQKGQNREWELTQFIPHMEKMMDELKTDNDLDDYRIYVIEQDQSLKKFNRGLLLNIGAHLSDKGHSTIILHDVDLLPQEDIKEWYSFQPTKFPLHIAACWKERYDSKSYFGGVVSFNRNLFEEINGFPNNFWGWGGEDDALLDRCKTHHIEHKRVPKGTFKDIETNDKGEGMNLAAKLQFLRENRTWKCNDRWERRDRDKWIYKTCGYNQVKGLFKEVSLEGNGNVIHIKVMI